MNSRNLQSSTTGQSPRSRLWLWVLAASIALGAPALFIGLKATGRHAKPAAHDDANAPRSPQARPAGIHVSATALRKKPSLGFQPGDCLRYEFVQNRAIQLDLSNLATGAASGSATSGRLRVEQRGELIVKIYDKTSGEEGGWVVGFELQRPSIRVSALDANRTAADQDFSKAMTGEILAFVEQNGRIGKFIAPPAMSVDALNQWKDILARWQVVLADDESASRWTRREEDPTGVYLAIYHRQACSPPQITKTKTSYIEVRTTTQATLDGTSAITGNTVITLNPYPIRIAGQENLKLVSRGLGPTISSEADFTFQLQRSAYHGDIVKAGPGKTAQLTTMHALPWTTQFSPTENTPVIAPGTGVAVARTQIAGLQELLNKGGAQSTEEQKFMEKLHDAIKADDGTVEALMDQLAQPDCSKDMASVLIGVLGAAGTPMAQHSLLSMFADANWPEGQRQMSIYSFAQVQQPVPEIDAVLQSLHTQQGAYANNALLVLAAMGNRVQTSDPQRFDLISQYVLNAASQTGIDHNSQLNALAAVGNLGPNEVPDVVTREFASDDALVRRAAVESLERVTSDQANKMIQQALVNDDAENVRAAAAKLLADPQRSGAAGILAQALTDDKSDVVRKTALLSLNQFAEANQQAASQIARVAQQDPSAEVRDLASLLLAVRTTGSQVP